MVILTTHPNKDELLCFVKSSHAGPSLVFATETLTGKVNVEFCGWHEAPLKKITMRPQSSVIKQKTVLSNDFLYLDGIDNL